MPMDDISNNPFAALFGDPGRARLALQRNQEKAVSDSKRLCTDETNGSGVDSALTNGSDPVSAPISAPVSVSAPIFAVDAVAVPQASPSTLALNTLALNNALERIFLLTVDVSDQYQDLSADGRGRPTTCYELEDSASHDWLEMGLVEMAVFERLMATKEDQRLRVRQIANGQKDTREDCREFRVIPYLFQCFVRLKEERSTLDSSQLLACTQVILQNARTSLQTPDLYEGQDPLRQLFSVCYNEVKDASETAALEFFQGVFEDFDDDCSTTTKAEVLEVFYHGCMTESQTLELASPQLTHLAKTLQFFATSSDGVKTFFHLATPKPRSALPLPLAGLSNLSGGANSLAMGREFENSLLGKILCQSPIAKNEVDSFNNFFDSPSRKTQQEIDVIQQNLWRPLELLRSLVHHFFKRILRLRDDEATNCLLTWIADCIAANKGRAKLGTQLQMALPSRLFHAGDGFFMNLTAVLLMMAKPFSGVENPKLLLIDGRYATSSSSKARGLKEETKLIPGEEGETRSSDAASFGLTTELFFLAHACYQVGFHCVSKTFLEMNQEMHQLQAAFRDSQAGQTEVPELKERLEKTMSKYLSVKAVLLEPGVMEGSEAFIGATVAWLNQLARGHEGDGDQVSSPSFQPIFLPLPPNVASSPLAFVPELVVNNITEFFLFTHRFNRSAFSGMAATMDCLLTFLLIFMGDGTRMKNPHLRAQLAEVLEVFMPVEDDAAKSVFVASTIPTNVEEHEHGVEVAPTLLKVFVSIEMTGEAVDENMIYSYRRPMYKILNHLWSSPRHNQKIVQLAQAAYVDIENPDPPLFLKFINYLCNDAVYLLDEALGLMKKIRDKQQEKMRGDWDALSEAEKKEKEDELKMNVRQSRFYNIMGKETIKVLSLLTSKIVDIFIHPVMLQRITSMLNYFLFQLCGPSRKELKVADFEKVDFDPGELVATIAAIYIHLQESDDFCRAVSRDERSYRPELFDDVHDVLARTGRGALLSDVAALTARIKSLGQSALEQELMTEDAPEEFLDAMMYTFMTDPVILPASKQVVDRANIARHILSSQTDPFNREPLTMEMVIPHAELKAKIEAWLQDKRNQQ